MKCQVAMPDTLIFIFVEQKFIDYQTSVNCFRFKILMLFFHYTLQKTNNYKSINCGIRFSQIAFRLL